MDDKVWKNLSMALGIGCAVLLGIAGALMVVHKGPSSASPAPDSGLSVGSPAPTDSVPGALEAHTAVAVRSAIVPSA